MELKDKDNPHGEIEIIFTGLRPGEKLYEEPLSGENVSTTQHKKILRAKEDFLIKDDLDLFLQRMKEAELTNDVIRLKKILEEAIPGFIPDKKSVDVFYLQKNKSSNK